jgi:hypothetical protein
MNRVVCWLTCFAITALVIACDASASDDFPPSVSECINAAQQRAKQSESRGEGVVKVDRRLQQQIADCTMDAKLTKAQRARVGIVNNDYTQIARALVAGTLTPIKYVRRVQNRTDKLNRCLNEKSWASAVIRGDRDGDLIPDAKDRCPDTKPLEPTDDYGCPLKIEETKKSPSAEEVQVLLNRMGYIADAQCKEAPTSTTPAPISFSYLLLSQVPSRLEIEFGRIKNQLTDCGILYEVLVHGERNGGAPDEDLAVIRFTFRATEDTASPPSAETITVLKTFNGAGPLNYPNLFWKIRAVNSNGAVSPWSELRKGSFFIS